MSCYPLPLDVRALKGGKRWALLQNFQYQSDKYKRTITAKTGFEFDFASIPRWLWRLLGSPATGLHRRGAVIHDWLYKHGASIGISQKEADGIFYEAMICSGVNAVKAWLMYRGVRMFGNSSYNELDN